MKHFIAFIAILFAALIIASGPLYAADKTPLTVQVTVVYDANGGDDANKVLSEILKAGGKITEVKLKSSVMVNKAAIQKKQPQIKPAGK